MGKETRINYPTSRIFRFPPSEYLGLMRTVGSNNLDRIFNDLSGVPIPGGAAIVVVGSDGKFEANARSKPEIAIWDASGSTQSQEIEAWYNATHPTSYKLNYDQGLDSPIEVKDLRDPLIPVYSFGRNNCNIYPDRTINASYVTGNNQIYKDTRRKALEIMSAPNEDGVRVRRALRNQLKTYQAALATGVYHGSPVVDFELEHQLYATDWKITGFKVPVLRLVQRSLDIVTARNLMRNRMTIEQAMRLSTNTADRIQGLVKNGVLSANMLSLIDAYGWFLQEYHFAQETSGQTDGVTRIPYDSIIYHDVSSLLCKLVQNTMD
ncbi:hypothetical protein M1523_00480 [Patescibacteria group bacterium]|nr:hypothetical protein [Patescibacteria group bacterium]MCL5091617.1 hypothetical protein [Patescibacteria group bacterium]